MLPKANRLDLRLPSLRLLPHPVSLPTIAIWAGSLWLRTITLWAVRVRCPNATPPTPVGRSQACLSVALCVLALRRPRLKSLRRRKRELIMRTSHSLSYLRRKNSSSTSRRRAGYPYQSSPSLSRKRLGSSLPKWSSTRPIRRMRRVCRLSAISWASAAQTCRP